MAKEDKLDIRNAKRTASKLRKGQLRLSNSAAKEWNKSAKASQKAGTSKVQAKVTSSTIRLSKTNSAKMPSVAVKTGVKNKIKAQGKAMSKGGLNYSGRKK